MHRLRGLSQLFTHPTAAHFLVLMLLMVGIAIAFRVVRATSVTTVVTLGMAAEIFSGNWKYIPLPVPLDRVLLLLGLLLLIIRQAHNVSPYRVVIRPIHLLLLALATYALCSAIWAGTLTGSHGFYALLDRLGIIPFLFFTLAPVLFGTAKQRSALLAVMVVLGLYLGLVAFFEGVGPSSLVFPHYINNLTIGITEGRARGPFLASDAMGLALFDCGVFAAIALSVWKNRKARGLAYAVIVLCGCGVLFTLTRSSWLGAVAGIVVAMAIDARLRRIFPKVLLCFGLALAAIFIAVPALAQHVHSRATTELTVWDRYNTNWAAVRMVEAHPLFGMGWQTFELHSWNYLQEAGTYPLTGDSIEVHNVFLSHFAELGLIGGGLWIFAFLAGVVASAIRRGPPELRAWRLGLVAITTMFIVVANFVPLSYAFPNLVLWSLAGIVARDRMSALRVSQNLQYEGDFPIPALAG
jgi:putative inorganic carbon (HCO3(-)) transporter